ncbi:MAG: DUF4097 family beta strand repeat-containing protein [Vicinamibacterales bacterium]
MKPIFRAFPVMFALTVSAAALVTAAGQSPRTLSNDDWCDEGGGGRQERFCEVREFTVAKPSRLEVTDSPNGSIRVSGTNRSDVLVRARVSARADSMDEARDLARDVEVTIDNGRVRTNGPRTSGRRSWTVSYRIEAPRAIDLELDTANGSIDVSSIDGRIRAESSNGALRLTDLAGDVSARTSNGSVVAMLDGRAWRGTGFEATTSNGSVRLEVPDGYNARLEAGTSNGSLSIDFPVQVQGRLSRRLDVTLGDGGPTVRVQSSNGSVRIGRR